MDIKSLGGEFTLIKRISSKIPFNKNKILQSIGDDAAVIKTEKNFLTLITTDILVENIHYKKQWCKPSEIGIKAVECNASDIAAMGGIPTFMFISLILPHNTKVSWVDKLYEGILDSCNKYGITIAGGDTTKGKIQTINITLLGKVLPENLCLRSTAKFGDFLAVSGYIGGSSAGYSMLNSGRSDSKYLRYKHILPKSKLFTALLINSIVNAMIDISDSLSSEIKHICNNSLTGAKIYENLLPIHNDVKKEAKIIRKEPSSFALSGGEDLELLFTLNPKKLILLEKLQIPYYIIGKILKKSEINLINKIGNIKDLPLGFDHFI